jgi:multiple antibiotic resistance protein
MDFVASTITLFLVQDPIGNIPVFLSLLQLIPARRRIWIIIRENLIAFFILTLFLFGGSTLLKTLHLTEHGLGIAGGLILFVVAFKMIFSPSSTTQTSIELQEEPLIVPLAIPLLAGPSTIATITLLSKQHPHDILFGFLALAVVALLSTLILLLALPLYRLLGPKLLHAFEKLMGIILITIATQMTLDNFMAYIGTFLL